MIRPCDQSDFDRILEIINDGAQAYKGVVPEDIWPEPDTNPYMKAEQLQADIDDGVQFWGFEEDGKLVGVMGTQAVEKVSLIRHAYVLGDHQRKGIGAQLLSNLMKQSTDPTLVGTWTHASWAIHFYEKHGFTIVTTEVKTRLLNQYWKVPARQIEESIVLADQRWMARLEHY